MPYLVTEVTMQCVCRRSWIQAALPVVMLAALGCATPKPAALTETELQAIRDTVTALDNAMNLAVDNLDCAKGMVPVGDQDPLFVSNTMVVRSHAALQAACDGMVAPRTGAAYSVDQLSVHPLS